MFSQQKIVFSDFETAPIQRMTLQARDQGNPPRIGEVDLVVKIADTNDNDPVFERKVAHYIYCMVIYFGAGFIVI